VNFKKVFISELSPAKYNPRKDLVSSDPEYQRIKRSIEEFGYVDPIIINSDYTVIGGHQRLKVMRELGHAQIDVVVVDIPKDKEKALNIALNKITGEWDTQRLTDLLGELKADGMDISITGFDEKEFDGLLRELHKDDEPLDTEPQISRAEELRKEWGTEIGQMWQCGEHRVICGDCTDPAVVQRVMGGEKADLLVTDPPYGIKRDKGFEGFGGFGTPIARRRYEDNNWDSERPKKEAFDSILSLSKESMIFGGNFFADLLPQGKHWIVWDKKNTMPTFGDCELIWTNIARNSVKKITFEYNGLIGKEKERYHPTQKPVALIVDLLSDYSKDNQTVLDPFLGSGTTMIACENLGRKCRGCEIDPGYVAVILQRYKDTFKKEPVLLKEGQEIRINSGKRGKAKA